MKRVLITGAAGNLGRLLAKHLLPREILLNLMIHKQDVDDELKFHSNVGVFRADLADTRSLSEPLKGVDTIVHFAGVLFKHNPETFLPTTNTLYFKNLLEVALEKKVKRIILISFPHVEGETRPDNPAQGRLDGTPVSVHASTRLEEEKMLFEKCKSNNVEAVSLRLGMVYGKGILMIEGARWFSKHGLLGVWNKPTYIHLISTIDFLEATTQAILCPNISGIYHLGDDGVQTLQEFLNDATAFWNTRKPWIMPVWMILSAAKVFELFSRLFNIRSPLTVDFIKIGMVSYYGDTERMKKELLPVLKYRNYREGIETL